MSLMSALYVGSGGLRVSQNALNTTAHNVSNADTTGYTRQQVQLGNMSYNTVKLKYKGESNSQIGLGVMYTSTRQVRDTFLDRTYRLESGRSAFYEVSYNTLVQTENILGEAEPSQNPFQNALDNLWTAVQELAKEPNSAVNQGLLVQRASQFIAEADTVKNELYTYQDNLNTQVSDTVAKINQYGQAIKELNHQILKIESAGVENANDLRDQRNYYLDQLGELCNMSYSTDAFGNVEIKVEGEIFLSRDTVYEIGLYRDTNGFYTPYWPQMAKDIINPDGTAGIDISNAKVVNTDRPISAALNTDVGKLEGLLRARGDHRANYTDLDKDVYDSISDSLMMNIEAEFDQLIHNVVTQMNDILAEASDPKSGYLCNADGSPIQLFEKVSGKTYSYDAITDTWVKEEDDPDYPENMMTVGNIILNQDLMKQPTLLSFVRADQSTDFETAKKLAEAFSEEKYILNPNLETPSNFSDYYINLVNQVGTSGSVYKSLVENQEDTVSSTEEARQQIIGVSTDEELTYMIKFQNAYNAASRYINAVDELLQNLINSMA